MRYPYMASFCSPELLPRFQYTVHLVSYLRGKKLKARFQYNYNEYYIRLYKLIVKTLTFSLYVAQHQSELEFALYLRVCECDPKPVSEYRPGKLINAVTYCHYFVWQDM